MIDNFDNEPEGLSETDEQKVLVAWYRDTWPEHSMALRVSQSGGYRGAGRKGAIRTALIKAMGGIKGESDIAILLPRGGYGSFLMEHKKFTDRKGPSDEQIDYVEYHNRAGNCACVTKGLRMAKIAIRQYMEGRRPNIPVSD